MPADRDRRSRFTLAFVAFTVGSVAALDVATGVLMLTSPQPWRAHGGGTLWTHAEVVAAQGPVRDALMAAWHRLAAFSLFAGLSTLVWLGRSLLADRTILRTLLWTYLIAGLGFGYTDALWFSDTNYHAAKGAIGAVWVVALIAWEIELRRERRAQSTVS